MAINPDVHMSASPDIPVPLRRLRSPRGRGAPPSRVPGGGQAEAQAGNTTLDGHRPIASARTSHHAAHRTVNARPRKAHLLGAPAEGLRAVSGGSEATCDSLAWWDAVWQERDAHHRNWNGVTYVGAYRALATQPARKRRWIAGGYMKEV